MIEGDVSFTPSPLFICFALQTNGVIVSKVISNYTPPTSKLLTASLEPGGHLTKVPAWINTQASTNS
jgi:hypothetical protein